MYPNINLLTEAKNMAPVIKMYHICVHRFAFFSVHYLVNLKFMIFNKQITSERNRSRLWLQNRISGALVLNDFKRKKWIIIKICILTMDKFWIGILQRLFSISFQTSNGLWFASKSHFCSDLKGFHHMVSVLWYWENLGSDCGLS